MANSSGTAEYWRVGSCDLSCSLASMVHQVADAVQDPADAVLTVGVVRGIRNMDRVRSAAAW
jgi:hypothetical protein